MRRLIREVPGGIAMLIAAALCFVFAVLLVQAILGLYRFAMTALFGV